MRVQAITRSKIKCMRYGARLFVRARVRVYACVSDRQRQSTSRRYLDKATTAEFLLDGSARGGIEHFLTHGRIIGRPSDKEPLVTEIVRGIQAKEHVARGAV